MGLIDKLKTSKEVEAITDYLKHLKPKIPNVAVTNVAQYSITEQEMIHKKRRQLAQLFHRLAHLDPLIDCFGDKVGGIGSEVRHPNHYLDPDSVIDTIEWNREPIGKVTQDFRTNIVVTKLTRIRFREDAICVETVPDGRIVFHSGSYLKALTFEQWKDQPSVFEHELDRAAKKPMHFKGIVCVYTEDTLSESPVISIFDHPVSLYEFDRFH